MSEEQITDVISDTELANLFLQTDLPQEKISIFGKIQDETLKIELLSAVPENERYKFIGKLKSPQDIAKVLNSLSNENSKVKTFNFVAKQFKGNNAGILEILNYIDFKVNIPSDMLVFKLNNINVLNLDFLTNIKSHVENYSEIQININENDARDFRYMNYSFHEMAAIIAKIEEMTADITEEMSEADKFYKIYSRITIMMTYDHDCIEKSQTSSENIRVIRRSAASLYGGLIDGKAICVGYALILHEALKYVGIKSQCVSGFTQDNGHEWIQVRIDGKWYNADPTWDSSMIQLEGKYKYMLLSDKQFEKTHGNYCYRRTKTYRRCKHAFDYSKIKELDSSKFSMRGRSTNR